MVAIIIQRFDFSNNQWDNPQNQYLESIDGNEYVFGRITANPGWCEPGDLQRQKILPERELKGNS